MVATVGMYLAIVRMLVMDQGILLKIKALIDVSILIMSNLINEQTFSSVTRYLSLFSHQVYNTEVHQM